ncbi:MAG: hypothetical protein H0U74_02015 [Bradymonadaceae bacterium]|nr:hypothetical protein [Lujinxingiaceae bacterium]
MNKLKGCVIAVLAVIMPSLLGASSAFACDPSPNCRVNVVSEDTPACLTIERGEDWTLERDQEGGPTCRWYFMVINRCAEAVELVELECGEDCLEPVVVEANASGEVGVRNPQQKGTLNGQFGWSMGESMGTIGVAAHYLALDQYPCEGCFGCQSAPGTVPPLPVLVVLALVGGWAARKAWRGKGGLSMRS